MCHPEEKEVSLYQTISMNLIFIPILVLFHQKGATKNINASSRLHTAYPSAPHIQVHFPPTPPTLPGHYWLYWLRCTSILTLFGRNRSSPHPSETHTSRRLLQSLSYDGTEYPDYPHAFELRTRVQLCDDNLEQHLEVTNKSALEPGWADGTTRLGSASAGLRGCAELVLAG